MLGESIEMIASQKPEANKMGAYEIVLTNAMARDDARGGEDLHAVTDGRDRLVLLSEVANDAEHLFVEP